MSSTKVGVVVILAILAGVQCKQSVDDEVDLVLLETILPEMNEDADSMFNAISKIGESLNDILEDNNTDGSLALIKKSVAMQLDQARVDITECRDDLDDAIEKIKAHNKKQRASCQLVARIRAALNGACEKIEYFNIAQVLLGHLDDCPSMACKQLLVNLAILSKRSSQNQ